MSPERWHRITEIFHAVLEQPPSRADEFLQGACGDDVELRGEVREMIEEYARSGFLDQPPPGVEPTATPPVFAGGQTVSGRYRIVRFLNRGGMGEVYEAEDLELKERVALKTLLTAIADDARMIARFKQEIQLSRKIAHPNVCRVFDLARHPVDGSSPETTYFLTMELLPGETLAALLDRERRMGPSAALPLMQQMADALDAAHRCGIIHRDFKPSNVMLTPEGAEVRAVVTDFGLARSFGPAPRETTATATGNVMGTLDYMAPELLTGTPASIASDVYALGMVAYRMVTGALPFPSDTPLAGAILRSRVPVPSPKVLAPDLDPKWERAILRALDPEPARRFGRASDFVAALRGESAAVMVPLPVMTRRRWVGAAVVVLGVIGGWVGWREWRQARNRPSPEAAMLYQKGVDDIHAGAYFAATKALGEAVRVAPHFGLAHARLAEAWVELTVPERASQEMLLARRQDSSDLSKLDRLQIEAIDLTITREFAAAAAKYDEMRRLSPEDLDLCVDYGRAAEKAAGLQSKAIESYRKSAESASHNPAAWLRLAILYSRAPDWQKSGEAFKQAESRYQLTSNLEGLIEVAYDRGVAADRRGDFEEAAADLSKALETARQAGNVYQEIRAKLQLSTNGFLAGDATLAERYAQEAIDTARTNQMEAFAVSGIINLGGSYMRKGDFTTAEKHYRDGLQLARRSGAEQLTAVALLSLASLHAQIRSPEEEQEAQGALAYYESHGFAQESSSALTLLGRLERDRGHQPAALAYFKKSLDLATKAQDRRIMAQGHEAIGSVLFEEELYPAALAEYQENLELSPGAELKGYAGLQCGNTLWRLGLYEEAQRMFADADGKAEKFPLLRLQLMLARAGMALSQNRAAEAAAIARSALAADTVHNPLTVVRLKRIIGLAQLSSANKREGLQYCEESLKAVSQLNVPGDLLQARLAAAQALLETGNRAAALDLLRLTEPMLSDYPESRWRAFALFALIDPQYAARARDALTDLGRSWGKASQTSYLKRPDIQKISWHLLPSVSANPK